MSTSHETPKGFCHALGMGFDATPEQLKKVSGGGIAGLWLNARLRQAGYQSLLVERGALGGGQSVKSQGIIHGGI